MAECHCCGEAHAKVLKQIRQSVGAQIRLGNDKRGKIVERQDGTIGIDWHVNLTEKITVSDKVEKEKKENEF